LRQLQLADDATALRNVLRFWTLSGAVGLSSARRNALRSAALRSAALRSAALSSYRIRSLARREQECALALTELALVAAMQ